jgi:hypothetical protein
MSRSLGGAVRRGWLSPQRLEYVSLDDELAVVRVLGRLDRGLRPPPETALVAGTAHIVQRAPVLGSVTHRATRRPRPADHLLWRVTFALPLELLECPQTLFALTARDCLPTRLPTPTESTLEELCRHWELGPRGAALLSAVAWRRAAALGTAVAVAGSSALPPAGAFASAGHPSRDIRPKHAVVQQVPHSLPKAHIAAPAPPRAHIALSAPSGRPQAELSSDRVARHHAARVQHGASTSDPAIPRHSAAAHHGQAQSRHTRPAPAQTSAAAKPTSAASAQTTATPAPGGASLNPARPASGIAAGQGTRGHRHRRHHHRPTDLQTQVAGSSSGLSSITPTPPTGLAPAGGVRDPRRAAGHHHRAENRQARPVLSGGSGLPSLTPSPPGHLSGPATHPPSGQAPPVSSPGVSASFEPFWTPGMGSSSAEVAFLSHLSALFTKGLQPPAFLLPIYQAAGLRFNIPWQVLAAINSIETDYGRNLSISSAGAIGWMQFMPATWVRYGMSVSGHAVPNPFDPADAIFSAARYLAANGGARHLRQAIFAYNHAQWYVDAVMWRASLITDPADVRGLDRYALPLDVKYVHAVRPGHDGVEIQGAPAGAPVQSITTGVVSALAKDPTGQGADYPVIEVTKGPLAGRHIYYGQVGASLVKVGQRVYPGQPIALVGHTSGPALDHGRIEVGFSDASGRPINHRDPIKAWAPSVATMRRVVSALVAEKMLRIARHAAGGPYSVSNHATAFTQSASWLKQDGTDCSGFVSWLLGPRGVGYWPISYATPSIPTAPHIRAGFGEYVTLWNNPAAASSGHVFIEILGHWFESAGGIGIHEMPVGEAMNYIASGLYTPHHPLGL